MPTTQDAKPSAVPDRDAPPVVVEVEVTVKALAFREADGGYSVIVPELPGCVTQGESIEDVRYMVRDLANALLDMKHEADREAAIQEFNEPIPGEPVR